MNPLMENYQPNQNFSFANWQFASERIWEVPIFSSAVSYGRSNLASQCGVRALVSLLALPKPWACGQIHSKQL